MIATIVRRLRLPAHQSSPGAARSAVRGVITESGLEGVADEALLLTTELSTNSVVHAGTDLELEIVADAEGLTVTVMDSLSGPLAGGGEWVTAAREEAGPDAGARRQKSLHELAERGRGLLLVDRLSSSWGTLHHPAGKGVWFRLARPGRPAPAVSGAAIATASAGRSGTAGDPAADSVVSAAVAALAAVAGRVDGGSEPATLSGAAEQLLSRVSAVVGARGALALVNEGDGNGPQPIASHGVVPGPGADAAPSVRVPLRLTSPWRGELRFTLADRPDAGAAAAALTVSLTASLAELTAERLSLLVENHRLRRANLERRSWLTFLAEASQLLAQSLDVELTLALIPRLVVPRLGRWCAVHTADGDRLDLAAATHADESQVPALLAALEVAEPRLIEALQMDAVVPLAAPVEGYVVSLIARGQQLGTLSVGRGIEHWQSTEEVGVVEDVARRAALAIDNARIHAERRAIARTLQRSLLPPELPKMPGIDFGAEYVPTGEGVDVGGDFYDVVVLSDHRWLVMVGDVSGKGVHAATVTGLVRDVTRVLVRDGRTLPEALARLNETLVERGAGRFCTLALAAVTRRDDDVLDVTLHLAGHDKPVLILADGTTRLVGECGTALGLLDRVLSPSARVALGPGDTLVFYTDGVTERRRGAELFGVDRLCSEAGALAGFPAEVVAARLRAATLSFSPESPRDDIAIFAVRNDAPG